jgi:hypothetical protein
VAECSTALQRRHPTSHACATALLTFNTALFLSLVIPGFSPYPPLYCAVLLQSIQRGPLHLAATIHLGLQSDPYFTTQNQVEVFTPGTLQRARLPLEATIRISPTMQLTNGLPYDVLGWAIAPPHKEPAGGGAAAASSAAAAAAKAVATDSGAAAMPSAGSETADGAQPAATGSGRRSIELQPVPGGAASKKEAELALARLVAGGWHLLSRRSLTYHSRQTCAPAAPEAPQVDSVAVVHQLDSIFAELCGQQPSEYAADRAC